MYLDVRTNEEWAEGHVKEALHFELARFEAGEFPDLPKDTEIKIYCGSGASAEIAKSILDSAGFSNVTNAGGLDDLRDQGLLIE